MPHITAMNANSQAVLVTGASKGIGEAVAGRLAEIGMTVFAGVRQDADAERWRNHAGARVHPVRIDVTDEASIHDAVQQMQTVLDGRLLTGLVNNAGIAVAGPLEFLPIRELRRQLEVNVIGQMAVTQAVLPLLRVSRGRVVNIGSISGRSALPMTGAYAASKFAMEALTDALRVELMPAGIDVSIVEPGVIATPIWETSLETADTLMKEMPKAAIDYYGRIIDAARARVLRSVSQGLPPSAVAEVVVHALTARRPKTRYLVGRDARTRALFQHLPDRLRDRLIARQLAKL
jgi:NAD(P)-dependent dehydrogenase (short-subunit alcohol dehydrogenase family)